MYKRQVVGGLTYYFTEMLQIKPFNVILYDDMIHSPAFKEEPRYTSVSYTHLDVYKRQDEMTVNSSTYAIPFYQSLGFDKIAGKQCTNAVSYTHLDVYKRQVRYYPVKPKAGP